MRTDGKIPVGDMFWAPNSLMVGVANITDKVIVHRDRVVPVPIYQSPLSVIVSFNQTPTTIIRQPPMPSSRLLNNLDTEVTNADLPEDVRAILFRILDEILRPYRRGL